MFDNIFAAIEKWMRELLTGMVESNMSTMFTDVNEKTSEIAAQVGRTPQNWNSSVFSMIQNLSESVVVPIAGIIITLVLCYELISMLTERNNLHDVDTWMFFKYFVKAWVAIYLVSNTFTITMAVFDVGQSVVNSASGIINGETAIDVSSLSMQMQAAMATMEIGELVVLALETFLVSFSYDRILQSGMTTKDFIAPTSFLFKSGKDFQMGDTIGAVSYLNILAPELTDKVLAEFLDMDKNLVVSIHVQSVDQLKAIKLIKGKITDLDRMKIEEQKKAVRSGYDMEIIPSDLATYGGEAKKILDDLQSRNERMQDIEKRNVNCIIVKDGKQIYLPFIYQCRGDDIWASGNVHVEVINRLNTVLEHRESIVNNIASKLEAVQKKSMFQIEELF